MPYKNYVRRMLTVVVLIALSPMMAMLAPVQAQASSGELVDFDTGSGTAVMLTVTGGSFNGSSHATQHSGAPAAGTDAYSVFNGKLNAFGSVSYQNSVPPAGDLVLRFTGMDPSKTYELVFYGHRNKYGWGRASLVTISGADFFTNQSSVATDNPEPGSGSAIFFGPSDDSTRLPADNDNGYVARFTDIDPGADGQVVLSVSWDGTPGNEYKGKYANAVMLKEVAGGSSQQQTFLEDIDSGLTSPTGDYRWLDVADQTYREDYRTSYNYTQATVELTYDAAGKTLHGTLNATNLKPNFAYQIKLVGFSGTPANERIGLAGRWWQEEWNGSEWTNGQNLNNKGDGAYPNPNDDSYFVLRDLANPTSPTGLKYRYTGYLVFDYFVTDENGNAAVPFEANSSYHVLWKTSQRLRTVNDGSLKPSTFDADLSGAYDDTGGDDYPSQTVSIFGEWERLAVGGVYLQPGEYLAQMILTEESFHGSGGSFAGNWAGAMGAEIQFNIE